MYNFNLDTIMGNEIFNEPKLLTQTIENNAATLAKIKKQVEERGIYNIVTLSRGSSDNAGTCFQYYAGMFANKFVGRYHPSVVTVYNSNIDMSKTMLVAISQSGMSTDTIEVVQNAVKNGAMLVSITNDVNSKLAKLTDLHLDLAVEEEKSVAATKTYTSEVLLLAMLACTLGEYKYDFKQVPAKIEQALTQFGDALEVATSIKGRNDFIVLSRGTMQGTADELCLKLKECCYLFSVSFSCATFMHGPLSLIDQNANVIMLAPSGECEDDFIKMAVQIKEKGGNITAISDIAKVLDLADNKIKMPKLDNILAPIYYSTVIHMLALNLGTVKGVNVDAPRNLKKVTITK